MRRAMRRDGVIALGVSAAVIAVQWPFRLLMVSPGDEGAILSQAAGIVRGAVPYAESFHYAGPGVFYAVASSFAVGGVSTESARAFACLVFGLSAALAYAISRWWLGVGGALLMVGAWLVYRVAAYPHWQMVSYSTLAVTLALAAAWLTGVALDGRRSRWLVVAGVLAALACITKQDVGAFTTIALAVVTTFAFPRPRGLLSFAAGGLAVAGVVGGLAAWSGVLGEMLHQTVWLPLRGALSFEYLGRPPLWPLSGPDPELRRHAISYLPPIILDIDIRFLGSALYRDTGLVDVVLKVLYHLPWILAVALVVTEGWRALRTPDATVGTWRRRLLILICGAFTLAFSPPRDWVHLLVLYPPTLLALGMLLGPPARASRAVRGVVVTGVAVSLLGAGVLAAQLSSVLDTPITTTRGRLYGRGPLVQSLEDLVQVLATLPGPDHRAAVLPYHPLVNFLAERPQLSRWSYVWPADADPRRNDEIVDALDAAPSVPVVYVLSQFPTLPSFRDYAAPIFEHIARHYEVTHTVGGELGGLFFVVARRRVERGTRGLVEPATLAGGPARAGPTRDAMQALGPEDRAGHVGTAWWPFEQVVWLAPPPGGSVEIAREVVPGPATRVRVRYGLDSEGWTRWARTRARFHVAVDDGATTREVWSRQLHPFRHPEDRGWHDLEIPLGAWAGAAIRLRLGVSEVLPTRIDRPVAGWATFRIVDG